MKYFEWIVPFDWFFDREIDWFVCNVKKKLKLVEISIRSVDHARLQPMKRWRNTMETKWIQQQRQQWRVCAVYAHRTAYTSICVCYNIFLYICILNLKQVRTCFNVNRWEWASSIGLLQHTHDDTYEWMWCEDEKYRLSILMCGYHVFDVDEATRAKVKRFFFSVPNEHMYKTMRSAISIEIVKLSVFNSC